MDLCDTVTTPPTSCCGLDTACVCGEGSVEAIAPNHTFCRGRSRSSERGSESPQSLKVGRGPCTDSQARGSLSSHSICPKWLSHFHLPAAGPAPWVGVGLGLPGTGKPRGAGSTARWDSLHILNSGMGPHTHLPVPQCRLSQAHAWQLPLGLARGHHVPQQKHQGRVSCALSCARCFIQVPGSHIICLGKFHSPEWQNCPSAQVSWRPGAALGRGRALAWDRDPHAAGASLPSIAKDGLQSGCCVSSSSPAQIIPKENRPCHENI